MKLFFFLCFCPMLLTADFPIQCEGSTQITYIDSKEKANHTITCHEKVEIDLDHNYLQCLSHAHDKKKQVHFHDDLHDLYSDQLRATYTNVDKTLILDKLKIYGNVCLIQKNEASDDLAFDELQYALADELNFDYKTDLITLKSKENSNVLYYDQVNNYRISADEVIVTRNVETRKAIVNGIGRVRFTFEDEELDKFKKHFFGKGRGFDHAKF